MAEVKIIKASTTIQERKKKDNKNVLRVAAYARVSTGSEEQLMSYTNQQKYYIDFIKNKPDWKLVEVYADEAITGTKTDKREDFKRMIFDCLDGKIDMVITKSISRFARNTVDTLEYVRKLKEKHIAVFFEEENINTLTMDGELLLTILSSVAQQEVQNISEHVKLGLKMRMQRGQLVGFNKCLGYDYNKEDKSISINEDEAKIVKYIYSRYLEGVGASTIRNELDELGYKPPKGNKKVPKWHDTTIMKILKNEKYVGDIVSGKTFTIDPISKKRINNNGEEDMFYLKDHHEAIIDRRTWDLVQEIINKRSAAHRGNNQFTGTEWVAKKFAFSLMCKCGYCGSSLTRRAHAGKNYYRRTWQCITSSKGGKYKCKGALAIDETCLEKAFISVINFLNKDECEGKINEFIKFIGTALIDDNAVDNLSKIQSEIIELNNMKNNILDMAAKGLITKEDCETKYKSYNQELEIKKGALEELNDTKENINNAKNAIKEFKNFIKLEKELEEFDRGLFEEYVDKIIIGGLDENGNNDPHLINFIFKSGTIKNKRLVEQGIDDNRIVTLFENIKVPYEHYMFKTKEDGTKTRLLYRNVNVKISVDLGINISNN